MNGAAVLQSEKADMNEILFPTGFQVLEEMIFDDAAEPDRDELAEQIDKMVWVINLLNQRGNSQPWTDADLFDAIRLNLYRLATKGLAGFDSPVAAHSLLEALITLQSSMDVLVLNGHITTTTKNAFKQTISFIRQAKDIAHFDFAYFYSRPYKRLMQALHNDQLSFHIPFNTTIRAVKPAAQSIFVKDAFDPYFFAPAGTSQATPIEIALGKNLFNDATLSQGGRSCASCHNPNKAFADGLQVNTSLLGENNLVRNTPTLLNASLQPSLFYDARVDYLEDQAHDVISNKAEMGGGLANGLQVLANNKNYQGMFTKAFPKDTLKISDKNVYKALASYVRSLNDLDSRFDYYMQGDFTQLNETEIKGFNLFMGKAKCGSCHYMPLFNGAVPPLYNRVEGEVLGVPATLNSKPLLDQDEGMYVLAHAAHSKHAFRTPTLRNAAITAPYMHNGVFKTLEEVIDFYDKGGGTGLGIYVENQSLSSDSLHLAVDEKQALIAFIKTLNGSSPKSVTTIKRR